MKIITAIILLEILSILGLLVLCILICLNQGTEVIRVMLPLGFWVLSIVGFTNLLIDNYKEKHQKYQIVYLIEKEKEE